jgi:putative membrane protein
MQPQSKQLLRFLLSWLINTLAVLVTVIILRNHINCGGKLENLLVASFLLGILNAFIRPILVVFALPLLILTLGLFMLVINALMLYLLDALLPFFHVENFGYALLGALIISFISGTLNILTGISKARISIQRRPPPSNKKPDDDGHGPVIDV